MSTMARIILLTLLLGLGAQIAIGQTGRSSGEESIPLDEIRMFTEVFAKVKNDYVDVVDDKQLLESAIRGMLNGLDPHSTYLDQEAYLELKEGTTGKFGGLGIEVGLEDGFVRVIAPIDDTPAARAGIQPGDLIIRLDDTPVKGMALSDAVQLMRGEPGTDITLTLTRQGVEKPITITLTRDTIQVQSVRARTLEPGFGYIRVSNFQSNTGEDLRRTISDLKRENEKLDGLILDLRNNPGGVLSAAVSVADVFLDKGLIVYTEGRGDDAQLKFNARPVDMLKGSPMVVLVNSGSASASEIVAGALQDHKRAVVMGEKTFGKGSVQTILPMANETALKLTTARYFTPSGRSIQAEGIKPDIEIEKVRVAAADDDGPAAVTEADLSRHLRGRPQPGVEAIDDEKKSLATTDYELYEALNLLKGIAIMGQRR